MARAAIVERSTCETTVRLEMQIEGEGRFEGDSGIGFLNHMLAQLAKHSLFDLSLSCRGDLNVDQHHTVEDIGICLGLALRQVIADGTGIHRYGTALVPMDEALVLVSLDLSGRPGLFSQWQTAASKIGEFDAELVPEFLRALANSAAMTVHVRAIAGENAHHICEATFKALGLALRQAVEIDPRRKGIPSTKGTLS